MVDWTDVLSSLSPAAAAVVSAACRGRAPWHAHSPGPGDDNTCIVLNI